MIPSATSSSFYLTKDQQHRTKPMHHGTEDGYHSLSGGSQWTPPTANTPAEFTHHPPPSVSYLTGFLRNNTAPVSPPIAQNRDMFSSFESAFLNKTNNNNNNTTSNTLDGRGILIERIKLAQNTIDSLSNKVMFYENERVVLKEQKEQFEKGYYKLVQENSSLLNDRIHKDSLLKKINVMGDEVAQLLQTQETLHTKHKEQQKCIEHYKSQCIFNEEEIQVLRKVNEELKLESNKDAALAERLKSSEEELKNQAIVLKIEKETLSSELERLINKLKKQDERLRSRKEKEQELVKENSLLRQNSRSRDRKLDSANESLSYLQEQLQLVAEEKNEVLDESQQEVAAAFEELKMVRENLAACQKELSTEKERVAENMKQKEKLDEQCNELNSLLRDSESNLKSQLTSIEDLERNVAEVGCKLVNAERDNAGLKQRLKNVKQENSSLNSTVRSKDLQLSELTHELEQNAKKWRDEIENLECEKIQTKESIENECASRVAEAEKTRRLTEENATRLQAELESVKHHFIAYKDEQEASASFDQQEIQDLRNTISTLSESLKNAERQVQQLNEKLDEVSKKLKGVELEHEDLQSEFQKQYATVNEQKQHIDQLGSEYEELKCKDTENLALIEKLHKQAKSETALQKTTYESQLQVLETDYESLKLALKNAEQEKSICIETYKKQIITLHRQSDSDVEILTQERDEASASLQTANLDLDEYKSKFESLEKELEEVSSVNADLKHNLSLLSKELETYQQESQQTLEKEEQISELQSIIHSLRKREEEMAIVISKNKNEKNEHSQQTRQLQEENTTLRRLQETLERERECAKRELDDSVANLTKSQKEFQVRNDKLKAECRKRAMKSHATCGELEVVKAELTSVRKELEVLVELNKKLELVNETLQEENTDMQMSIQQLQNDMGLLKTSYEDLLAKELSKQKSEFILKENELLKRLSHDRLDVRASTPLSK